MAKLLKEMKCIGCEGGIEPLSVERAKELLTQTPEWQLAADNKSISKTFIFKGFGKTMLFVNAVAWIANQEGHHPDLQVSFDRCTVNFTTHAVQGLTDNDFICAAKVDALL
ncbi:MAG: 4a-hydroxytetrahydrobiopterin dehydratase [Gammaproteobacteria bacterium]